MPIMHGVTPQSHGVLSLSSKPAYSQRSNPNKLFKKDDETILIKQLQEMWEGDPAVRSLFSPYDTLGTPLSQNKETFSNEESSPSPDTGLRLRSGKPRSNSDCSDDSTGSINTRPSSIHSD